MMASTKAKASQTDRHVIPRKDLVGHNNSPRCLCDPDVHRTKSGWVYLHNPFKVTDDEIEYAVVKSKD